MTKFDQDWAAREDAKRQWMTEHSLFREEDEHSSCGVGLVVSIDGSKSRKVVENGITALKANRRWRGHSRSDPASLLW